jgi:hypothetical protein
MRVVFLPRFSGDAAVGPLPLGSPGVETRHGGVGAALVHPHKKGGVLFPDALSESHPLFFVALGEA